MKIETDDLKVICDYCRSILKFEVKEGLHGQEINAAPCSCNEACDHCEEYSIGHSAGYDEGLSDSAPQKKSDGKPVDLSAKPL